jgi:hypothetical protein
MYVFARGLAGQGDSNIELPADAAEMGCPERIATLARFISPAALEKIGWCGGFAPGKSYSPIFFTELRHFRV